jgi:hypothetical protein
MTIFIIWGIGQLFFRWGKYYILIYFEEKVALSINKLLLVAYYLFNIGYALYQINNWGKILTITALVEKLMTEVGYIILLLGVMHYINLFIIQYIQKFIKI